MAKIQIFILLLLSVYADTQSILNLLSPLSTLSASSTSSNSGLEFRQREILNATTNTILEWHLDPDSSPNSTIYFNFSTTLSNPNTTVIFLGVSLTGHVDGADVVAVILGNSENLQANVVDMDGIDNSTLAPDTIQNWKLESIQHDFSSNSNTRVSFIVSRPLETCDQHDIWIKEDLLRIIWGYSDTNITTGNFNFTAEGSVRAYLTDPMIPHTLENLSSDSWRLVRTLNIPARHTSYWCTIHKGPQLQRKHHVVGYAPYFRDVTSQSHVHHLVVYRCTPPPGMDSRLFYEQFVGHPGEECYLEDNHQLPTTFCTEALSSWSVGGKNSTFPLDYGLAIGEQTNEYFMLETHYDNPEVRSDLVVESGVDFYYSENLRPNEGTLMFVGTGNFGLFRAPPHQQNFTVVGQCSSKCTEQMIPPSGVEVRIATLHGHLTARRMRLRHFRGNTELPWIQSDQNYDFSYQQKRLLSKPVQILPGDHLVMECVLNTTDRNSTTLTAFSTRNEMCISFLFITKRIPYLFCVSEYPTKRTMEQYGITNMTWNVQEQERVVNAAENPNFVGMPLDQVVDQVAGQWTPEMSRQLEMEQIYKEHDTSCQPVGLLGQLAHGVLIADDITGGLIPGREVLEQIRPTTRTISTTPPSFTTVRFPVRPRIYHPPEICK